MSKVFLATVENNNLHFSEGTLARLYDDMKAHPKSTYRVERVEKKRSLSQNARYWAYLGLVERETGNVAQDLHELFIRTLLLPKFINVMGKEVKVPRRTTELTANQFSEYLDKVVAECGIEMPSAEQLGYTPMSER